MQSPGSTPDGTPSTRDGGDSPGSVTLQMKQHYALANQRTPPTPDVRLYHRAVVVAQDTPGGVLVQVFAPLLSLLVLLMMLLVSNWVSNSQCISILEPMSILVGRWSAIIRILPLECAG